MRALCGAIITAGALIGLGLAALGIGIRFQSAAWDAGLNTPNAHVGPWLGYIVVFLTIMTIIGVVTAYIGLAYHHERRHREHLHLHGGAAAPTTTGLPR